MFLLALDDDDDDMVVFVFVREFLILLHSQLTLYLSHFIFYLFLLCCYFSTSTPSSSFQFLFRLVYNKTGTKNEQYWPRKTFSLMEILPSFVFYTAESGVSEKRDSYKENLLEGGKVWKKKEERKKNWKTFLFTRFLDFSSSVKESECTMKMERFAHVLFTRKIIRWIVHCKSRFQGRNATSLSDIAALKFRWIWNLRQVHVVRWRIKSKISFSQQISFWLEFYDKNINPLRYTMTCIMKNVVEM